MKKLIFLFAQILIVSCSSNDSGNAEERQSTSNPIVESGDNGFVPPGDPASGWSIPVELVLDGGPGKDGIPALSSPNFLPASEVEFLNDSDLVIGIKAGNVVRAYPHIILDWHEIVNDDLPGLSVAVTYCPLTGTGIGWNRIVQGTRTTFGVSGLLYNTNLIPYDRATDSNWSQILNESVNGERIGEEAELIALVETDWATWKRMYPTSEVLSTDTGFSRTYGLSPYGDYPNNNELFFFPVPKDNRLPLKERVLSLVDGNRSKVYRFEDFRSRNIILDNFAGQPYIIVGNQQFMVAFKSTPEISHLEFEYIWDGQSDALLRDQEGTVWNIFGIAISGPGSGDTLQSGDQLEAAEFFMAFWFSVPAFYNTVIY